MNIKNGRGQKNTAVGKKMQRSWKKRKNHPQFKCGPYEKGICLPSTRKFHVTGEKTMKLYKLTDKDGYTRDGTLNGPGITVTADGEGNDLCSNGVIHAYRDPVLAVMMAPIHVSKKYTRMLVVEGKVVADDGVKVGCKSITGIEWIDTPEITTEQRVAFGILAAEEVCTDPTWNRWRDNWISGKDRSALASGKVAVMELEVAGAMAARASLEAAVRGELPGSTAPVQEKGQGWFSALFTAARAEEAAQTAARAAEVSAWAIAARGEENKLDLISVAHQAIATMQDQDRENRNEGELT